MWMFIFGFLLGVMTHRHYAWKTVKDAEKKLNEQPVPQAQPEATKSF